MQRWVTSDVLRSSIIWLSATAQLVSWRESRGWTATFSRIISICWSRRA